MSEAWWRRSKSLHGTLRMLMNHVSRSVRLDASIEVQGEADPAAAARSAVDYVGERGLASRREVKADREFVPYLLEAKPLIRSAGRNDHSGPALISWHSFGSHPMFPGRLALDRIPDLAKDTLVEVVSGDEFLDSVRLSTAKLGALDE